MNNNQAINIYFSLAIFIEAQNKMDWKEEVLFHKQTTKVATRLSCYAALNVDFWEQEGEEAPESCYHILLSLALL